MSSVPLVGTSSSRSIGGDRLYRALFEYSTQPLLVHRDGWIVDGNAAAVQLIGGPGRDELIGGPISRFVHRDDLDRVSRRVAEMNQTGRPAPVEELRLITCDGKTIYVESVANPIPDPDGTLILVALRDITERRRKENILRESERRLRLVVENIPVVLFALDPEGTFFLSEGKGLEWLGLQAGEVVGRSAFDFYGAFPDVISMLKRATAGERFQTYVELNGRSYECSYAPVYETDGAFIGTIGLALDVTDRDHALSALRSSEERFRLLAENAQDVIFRYRYTPKPHFDYVSPSALTMLGFTPEDHYADPELGMKRTHPDDFSLIQRYVTQPESPTDAVTYRWIHKDGRVVWIEMRAVHHYNAKGRLETAEGILRDVTQRKLAEETIRTTHENLNRALEAAVMGTWDADLNTRIVTCPLITERIFGLPEGLQNHTIEAFYDTIVPDDREAVLSLTSQAVRTGEPFEYVYRIHRSDGRLRWLHSKGRVQVDDSGVPKRMLGTVVDVTQQKEAERVIREADERYRSFVEQSIAGVYVIQDERYVYVNARMAEIFGYTPEEMIALPSILDMIHPEDRIAVRSNVQLRIEGKRDEAHYVLRGIKKTGECRFAEVHGRRFTYQGKPATIGILIDVTERTLAEREREHLIDTLNYERGRLKRIFTHAPAFIATFTGPDHRFEMVNPACFRYIEPGDIIGKPLTSVIRGLKGQPGIDKLDEVYQTGQPYVGEEVPFTLIRYPEKTQETVYFNFVFHPLKDPDGTVTGVFFHGVDVTSQVEAREAITRASNANQLILDHSIDLICTLDKRSRIRQIGAACQVLLGYTPDELLGLSFLDLVISDDQKKTRNAARKVYAGENIQSFEVRHRRKDGTLVSFRWSAVWSERDRRMFCIGRDVTDRKKREERLRLLEAAVRQSADGIVIAEIREEHGKNPDQIPPVITYVNPAFEHMMGYSGAEIRGKSLNQLSGPETDIEELAHLIENLVKGNSYTGQNFVYRKDGTALPVESTVSPVRNEDGRLSHVVVIQRDITERKKMEASLREALDKAEDMSRLKDAFLANMSHEIRTPLTAIIGFTEVLAEEVSEQGKQFLEIVHNGGKRLLDTLNSVLDLAQLESRQMKLYPVRFDMVQVVQETVDLFSERARKRGIGLVLESAYLNLPVITDRKACIHILNNLVSNAVKFTHAGNVTVGLEKTGPNVRIRVTDTGIGIQPEFLPHVFDEFKQESSGLTRDYEGNGLGLTICKRLVDLMGGTIEVTSIKDQGSTFTVTIPMDAYHSV